MNGTTVVSGQELDVDMSFGTSSSNLQFGAMGLVVARKGDWGVGGDAIWMALGANGTTPGPVGITGSADMNQGAFSFYGLRRLAPVADLMFGGRVNTLQANLRFNGPGQRSVEGSKTWFDPLVGVQLRTPDTGKRWHAQVYTEIGGFGVGLHVHLADLPDRRREPRQKGRRSSSATAGSTSTTSRARTPTLFKWDVLTQGPVVGLVFKF